MLSASLSSALGSNVVAIEDVTVSSGREVVVPITIEHATGIGGMGIKLSYDPGVVTVTDATMGDFTAFFGFDNTNAANGWITINTYIMGQDLTGDVKVADVTLEAVGTRGGDTSPLNLEILSMATQYGIDVNGTTDNGVFIISSPSKEGGGTNNGWITTPHPTSTPPIIPPSAPPTTPTSTPPIIPTPTPSTNVPESPSTSRSTSNLSTPLNTSTPRTPGFKALLALAGILVVSSWSLWRNKGKF
jgi:hypothetical protein